MPPLEDCRISYLRPFGAKFGRLRVQHMPSGHEIDRHGIALRDQWPLDEMLAEIDQMIQKSPLHPKYNDR